MSRRAMLLLAAAGLVLMALVALERMSRTPPPGVGDLLLPSLRGQVEQISVIAVFGADGQATTLELRGSDWVVAELDDWPADLDTLSALMRALVAARRVEAMTSNPDRHARLRVDDPRDDGAGTAVELSHNGDVTTVIIGDTQVQGGDYSYMRIAGDDRAWLVDVAPTPPVDSDAWLDRRLLDLPEAELSAFTISHADDDDVRLLRDENDAWTLEPPAERAVLHDRILASTAGGLAGLRFERMVSGQDAPAAPEHELEATTRDGDRWALALWRDDGAHWLHVRWSGAGEVAEPPALAARTETRAFTIAEHRYRQLTRRRDDLLASPDGD